MENNDRHPDTVLAENDPGDETQKRFRYQAAVAVYYALDLLADITDLVEVFCEQHEDILIKRKDGKFIGIQVKTRREGLELFESNDDAIIDALVKFIKLDLEFPNCFEEFIIATNYSFYDAKENGNNLSYLIALAKQAIEVNSSINKRILSTYLNKLHPKVDCSTEKILQTLVKVRLTEFPKFENIQIQIIDLLRQVLKLGTKTYIELSIVTETLVNEFEKAGRREFDNSRFYFLGLAEDPDDEFTALIIEGKRITAKKLIDVIERNLDSDCVLPLRNSFPITQMPKGFRRLELKMSAGGISVDNIELAKNHKYQMEIMAARWIGKYEGKAQQRYEQIRSMVLTECREAYDEAYKNNEPFGKDMLINLRKRLRQRWERDGTLLYDCTYDHICGMAGVLTEECPVWWSDQFDLSREGQ